MKIKTKFSVGDRVYSLARTVVSEGKECGICKGEGRVVYKGVKGKHVCGYCHGKGKRHKRWVVHWKVRGCAAISAIEIRVSKRLKREVTNWIGSTGHFESEKTVFAHSSDAHKECEKKNKAERPKKKKAKRKK